MVITDIIVKCLEKKIPESIRCWQRLKINHSKVCATEVGCGGEGSFPSGELEDRRGPLHFSDVFFICSTSIRLRVDWDEELVAREGNNKEWFYIRMGKLQAN